MVIEHTTPMLSLAKCYDDAQLVAWAAKTGATEFAIQPKFDGVSLSLRYDNGQLVAAVLRGDGAKGDNVLDRVLLMQNVPKTALYGDVDEVRGEVIMTKTAFKKHAHVFANARNAVAGALNRKNAGKHDVIKDCTFIAYDVIDTGHAMASVRQVLKSLGNVGFVTAAGYSATIDDLLAVRERAAEDAPHADYELDGLVIKVMDRSFYPKLGATDHHPRWAIAYKFQGESGETVLRHVVWQVSRRGTLTPVAVVDPVTLSGVTVTRATLHNLDQLERLQAQVGDSVMMTRRGGVIPHVEHVTKPGVKRKAIKLPDECPSCGKPVERIGAVLQCAAPYACPQARKGAIVHYAHVFDIQGIGPETVDQLYEAGLLRSPIDLYNPRGDAGASWVPVIGKKTASKILAEVHKKATRVEMATLLTALGIDGLGSVTGRKIAEFFPSFKALLGNWMPVDLISEHYGIGDKTARAIYYGVGDNRDLIEALMDFIDIVAPKPANADATGPFVGKSVVFTGKLSDMDREAARALVRQYGGTAPDAITKTVDYLVVGDGAKDEQRTKRDKAAKYGIAIITEAEFAQMVADAIEGNEK